MIEGLTTDNSTRKAELFTWLLRMQCGNGLMHESVYLGGNVRICVLSMQRACLGACKPLQLQSGNVASETNANISNV